MTIPGEALQARLDGFNGAVRVRGHRAKPEEALQRTVAAFLRVAAPDLLWYAVPNGGSRHKIEAANLKATGVRAGVADLAFVLPGGQAAFIELKSDVGRQSDGQRAFERDAEAVGALYLVCRSLAEVQGALAAWGVKTRVAA